MLDQAFFPSPVCEEKQIKKYKEYDINVDILENFLKGEIVRPTWDHRKVGSLYSVCFNTERWKNMHPNQSMAFCKCGRIALQNINRKYGKGMDIAALHFPGLKENCVRKGYIWDSGL
jgi:hypothetical protein